MAEDRAIDERAPINAVDKLSCPILLLQGDEDKIVPPNQAELMHAALLKKGLPCALKIYEGERTASDRRRTLRTRPVGVSSTQRCLGSAGG